jgi:hypothetical protein
MYLMSARARRRAHPHHRVRCERAAHENPLPAIGEFQDFQAGLGAWLAAPPVPDQMTVVGSYGMFPAG